MGEVIDDGFGNDWEKCDRHDCDLQIVRPGSAQCVGDNDRIGCIYGPTLLSIAYAREVAHLNALLEVACGYISSGGNWGDKHPTEVRRWLEEAVESQAV